MIWAEERTMIFEARGLPPGHLVSIQHGKEGKVWFWDVSVCVDGEDDRPKPSCGHAAEFTITLAGEADTEQGARVGAEAGYRKALIAVKAVEEA